jgi:transcriptional antiterminator/mannitol/fructose-specific phosphotransferase system IIA component (Ntr-type)
MLRLLLDTHTRWTISSLASEFNIAPRTVRYDLQSLDDWLMKNANMSLKRIQGQGIWIEVTAEQKDFIVKAISCATTLQALSPQERQQIMIAELLSAVGPITIRHLERVTGYSESTLLKDLDQLCDQLKDRNLNLIRRPNYGLELSGPEHAYRDHIVEFLKAALTPADIVNLFNGKKATSSFGKYVPAFTANSQITDCAKAIRQVEANLAVRFSDAGLITLILHLAIARSRYARGKQLAIPNKKRQPLTYSKEYEFLALAAAPLDLPEFELCAITARIISSPRITDIADEGSNQRVNQMAMEIAAVAEGLLGAELSKDRKFIADLAQHLKPTINRIQHGIHMDNPLLESISQKFPKYLEAAVTATGIMQKYLNNRISDHETGFIALHIGAAVERATQRQRKQPQAILVCASGLGTSNILAARVKQEFPGIKIIGTASMFSVYNKDADLVITTVPIESGDYPTAIVDPFLPPNHVERIRKILLEIGFNSHDSFPGTVNPSSLVGNILELVEQYALITDHSALTEQIKDLFASLAYAQELDLPCYKGKSLQSHLCPDGILIQKGHLAWQQAVSLAGTLLFRKGAVGTGYVERMIRQIEQQGPYMVITPQIALVHTSAEEDVLETGFSLTIFPEGINFGHPRFDPVKLVFAFCSPDKISHLFALKQLMQVVADKILVEELARTESNIVASRLLESKLGSVVNECN